MNNRSLLIILVALGAIYALTQLFAKKKEGSFNTELIRIDTSKVTSITIIPKEKSPEIILKKEENAWIASNGTLSVKAIPSSVSGLLSNIELINTSRIVAKSQEKWADFEVDDQKGTRIKIYSNNTLLEDFIVGRFTYSQPPGGFNQQQPNFNNMSFTSYLRLADQDEVYAVDGMISMSLGNQNFDSFRDKKLFSFGAAARINAIEVSNNRDSSHITMQLQGNTWMLNNTQVLDSLKMANFITNINNLTGIEFADDFDELKAKSMLEKTITFKGDNLPESIVVESYYDTTRTKPFVLRSNKNQAFFSSDSSGIFGRLFKDPVEFLPASNQ